jgi:hypothetical protein
MSTGTETLDGLFREHEEKDVLRFASLEARLGKVEARVARGAFLGILVAEALRLGLADLPHLLPQILAALGGAQ